MDLLLIVFTNAVHLFENKNQVRRLCKIFLNPSCAQRLKIGHPFFAHSFFIIHLLFHLDDIPDRSLRSRIGDRDESPWLGMRAARCCAWNFFYFTLDVEKMVKNLERTSRSYDLVNNFPRYRIATEKSDGSSRRCHFIEFLSPSHDFLFGRPCVEVRNMFQVIG